MNFALEVADKIRDAALALVYPQPCALCGGSVESRRDGVVCAACWADTPIFKEDQGVCWKCGMLTAAPLVNSNRQDLRCALCDDDSFTAARACGSYEGGLRASILELKRQPAVSPRLVELLFQVLRRAPLNTADLILPVPLHPARERERGFNQALILATEIARHSGIPFDEHILVRQVPTPMHRAGMDAKARRKSVAGAFAIRHPNLIKGKNVLIVDDVFTTGATVSECAAALGLAGAAEVYVLTIARAAPGAGTVHA